MWIAYRVDDLLDVADGCLCLLHCDETIPLNECDGCGEVDLGNEEGIRQAWCNTW